MATLATLKARAKRKGVTVARASGMPGGPFTLTDVRTGDVIRADIEGEIQLEEAINWLDEPAAEPDTYDIAATRKALLKDDMRVATAREGTEFKGAACQCGRVLRRERRYWTHLDTGLVECD
jgi:hypothetical protein